MVSSTVFLRLVYTKKFVCKGCASIGMPGSHSRRGLSEELKISIVRLFVNSSSLIPSTPLPWFFFFFYLAIRLNLKQISVKKSDRQKKIYFFHGTHMGINTVYKVCRAVKHEIDNSNT